MQQLDVFFVAVLGVQRSATTEADAFGPFITLLSLIYSILLAQAYGYEVSNTTSRDATRVIPPLNT